MKELKQKYVCSNLETRKLRQGCCLNMQRLGQIKLCESKTWISEEKRKNKIKNKNCNIAKMFGFISDGH